MLTFASTAAALLPALALAAPFDEEVKLCLKSEDPLVELIILPLDTLLYAESADLVPGFAFSFCFDEAYLP